jgi:hypothetical protein
MAALIAQTESMTLARDTAQLRRWCIVCYDDDLLLLSDQIRRL